MGTPVADTGETSSEPFETDGYNDSVMGTIEDNPSPESEGARNAQRRDDTIYLSSVEPPRAAPTRAMNTPSSITDVAPFAIIDCGSSWSVVGKDWLSN